MAVYAAAKAGIAGFTRSLAAELLPRAVRVNAIAPAMVRTPENVDAAGPDATYVEMQHITDGILFLASPAGGYLTGKVLEVDGGIDQPNLDMGFPDLGAPE